MPRKPRRRAWGGGSIIGTRIFWREAGRRRSYRCQPGEDPEQELRERLARLAALAPGGPGLTLNELAEGDEGWLARRRRTHRDARNDANRWKRHLHGTVGNLKPNLVDQGTLRRLVDQKLGEVSPTTVRLILRLLSTFYSDLVDDGHARENPVKAMPRRLRRLVRPSHDPRTTPFLERMEDVRAVYLHMPERQALAFAIGALAGLRTGEVLALRWAHVDLEAGRIHVREATRDGKPTPLKDDESRLVPIQGSLLPLLRAAKLKSSHPMVIAHLRRHRRHRYMRRSTLWKALRLALAACKLPVTLTWYQCTRHTFASQWVLGGGTLESLRDVMGHSSVTVTERYSHLRPDERNKDLLRVDLSAATGTVIDIGS